MASIRVHGQGARSDQRFESLGGACGRIFGFAAPVACRRGDRPCDRSRHRHRLCPHRTFSHGDDPGGLGAGFVVALLTSLLARFTIIREDASLASLYLIALALGIFILSASGSAIPLTSFLFGSILGIDDETLIFIGITTTITLLSFAIILRPLIMSTIDPTYYESQVKRPGIVVQWFMLLVVLNLLGAFKALGTLMAVGLMILPATSASLLGLNPNQLSDHDIHVCHHKLLVRARNFVLRTERTIRTCHRTGRGRIFCSELPLGTTRLGFIHE